MSHCALSRLAAPIGQDVSIVHCPAAAALPLVTGQAAQPAPPRQQAALRGAETRASYRNPFPYYLCVGVPISCITYIHGVLIVS